MTPPEPFRDSQLDTLERLLDEEAALLEVRRSQLSSLGGAILDRDDEAVERLLDQIERAQQLQRNTDEQIDALRRDLAAAIGRPWAQVKLSTLVELVPAGRRDGLADRRRRIIERAEMLQLEHMRAVVLLRECSRVNRLLLEALLPSGGNVGTYGQRGGDTWQPGPGVVDTEQ